LQEAVPEAERVVAPPATENLKAAKWRLAVDLLAQTPDRLMDSSIGTDAMLTDHEPSTTHPSPCPQHKKSVARFLKQVNAQEFSSELAVKYQKRFEKSGPKMFTFLDHDGVPWNNTNAEHAIKRFAKYRKNTDGYFTERSLKEYLILASVLETCEFNNVNVLKFLLSREMTLEGLLRMSGRKRQSQTSLPAGLPADASPAIGSSP